ncbi:MAG: zinc ribbon domain-containing protein [Chloroflexota bacterium]|nr:zinc ribbon domain-containing protein [Chloroflexota bacterium]
MPMYEYFCPDCNVRFEKLIRHATPENAEGGIACPTCEQTDTRRVLSVVAAVTSSGSSMQMDGGCCGGSGEGYCACGMNRN